MCLFEYFMKGSSRAFRTPSEKNYNKSMPAKSKKQQMAAGAALSAKRGDTKKSSLKGASQSMYESMSEKELHDMASTSRKDKPKRTGKE